VRLIDWQKKKLLEKKMNIEEGKKMMQEISAK
jgi:hypothetical protein